MSKYRHITRELALRFRAHSSLRHSHPPRPIYNCHSMTARRILFILVFSLVAVIGCTQQHSAASATVSANEPDPATPAVAPSAPTQPAPQVNPTRAMQYVKEIVAFGSRPAGSPGHVKVEQYIQSKLKGDEVEVDAFTATTPAGKFPIHNIIAKFPGKKDGIIVIASHYDTNYPLPKEFVGANDGGSPSGLLLELATQFRGKPLDGYSVWLVWT